MRICVICEGCYPFVSGGVSSWLHGLICAMPQHEFVIWAIGAQMKQRGQYAYQMPPNVVELRDVYLDALANEHPKEAHGRFRLNDAQSEAVRQLLR